MPETEINLIIPGHDRKIIRDNLILEFLKENPGTGNGNLTSIYYYFVEQIADKRRIYLKRPARLNKGMDFEVNVEQSNFGTRRRTTMPSHPSIIADLTLKQQENPEEYAKAKLLIDRIYNCQDVSDDEMRALNFNIGHPIELILKIIKWLFIEQDVTYWNWSGRAMLYSGIP